MTIPLAQLDWDSNFFGFKTGRVSGAGAMDIRQALQQAREEEYQLIYAYSETPLSQELLDEFDGLDVGGQITFSKDIGEPPALQASGHAIHPYEEEEPTQAMIELALLSGHRSRFKTDARLPAGSYERMYDRWLRKNLKSGESGAAYIAGTPADTTGLITASWHGEECRVGLLAVSGLAQGKGIGSSLLRAMELGSAQRKVLQVFVRTQVANHRACAFYEKNGYKAMASTCLYHFCPSRNLADSGPAGRKTRAVPVHLFPLRSRH